jgi:hypothetical protein
MAGGLDFIELTTSYLDAEIDRGFWINRSHNLIEGATLTLDHRSGDLLIAFLALYVNASGRALWNSFVVCYTSKDLREPAQTGYTYKDKPLCGTRIWLSMRSSSSGIFGECGAKGC